MKKPSVLLICIILMLSFSMIGCSAQETAEHAESPSIVTSLVFDLKGQLFNADDSFLRDVTISLTFSDKTVFTAVTDATGSFIFESLPVAQNISISVLDVTGTQVYSSLLSIWPGYNLAYHNTRTTISLDMPENTLSMFVVCKVTKEGKLICSAITSEAAPTQSAGTISPSSSPGQSSQIQTMRVAGTDVKLRSEPSTDSQIVATLAKNSVVVLLGGNKEVGGYTWIKVTYTANSQAPITGYIRSDLLTQITPSPTPTP